MARPQPSQYNTIQYKKTICNALKVEIESEARAVAGLADVWALVNQEEKPGRDVKCDFRRHLNVCKVLDSRTQVGSWFHSVGAVKLKARLLKFVVYGGISRRLRFAERRLRDGLYGCRL